MQTDGELTFCLRVIGSTFLSQSACLLPVCLPVCQFVSQSASSKVMVDWSPVPVERLSPVTFKFWVDKGKAFDRVMLTCVTASRLFYKSVHIGMWEMLHKIFHPYSTLCPWMSAVVSIQRWDLQIWTKDFWIWKYYSTVRSITTKFDSTSRIDW